MGGNIRVAYLEIEYPWPLPIGRILPPEGEALFCRIGISRLSGPQPGRIIAGNPEPLYLN
jgi:hypothetical protein